jgi:nitroreductase
MPSSEFSGATCHDVPAQIRARRSVRAGFTSVPVADGLLVEVLRCGLSAPSSKNARPWRLHVVTDRGLLAELAHVVTQAEGVEEYVPHDPRTGRPHASYVSTVLESAEVLRAVPAAIFVENRGPFSGGGRRILAAVDRQALAAALVGFGLELIGVGAAVENMWLAAEALGLRAAFMGDVAIGDEAIRRRLDIAGDLVGVLVLGHAQPAEGPARSEPDVDDPAQVIWHRRPRG